jgi:hypothetical protein
MQGNTLRRGVMALMKISMHIGEPPISSAHREQMGGADLSVNGVTQLRRPDRDSHAAAGSE